MNKSTTSTRTVSTTTTRRVVRRSTSQDNQVVDLSHLLQNRLIRWAMLHIPLLFFLSLAIMSHTLLKIQSRYIHPYLQKMEFTEQRAEWEETYPRMECQSSDLSTADPRDLFLRKDSSVLEAVDKTLLHGAVVLPQVMNASVATKLRTYILKRNKELRAEEEIDVISNENRISFALSANEHKSVSEALQAIGTNQLFSETLQSLLGPDPALMELQVITAEHAQTQYWHADTIPDGSAIRYGRTFVPLYTLLIPLQDTDKDMGPTAVCPGSHRCYYTEGCTGQRVSATPGGFQAVDPDTGVWKAGNGLLYSSSTQHKGTAHVQGPARVALILSFASPPDHNRPSQYSRAPPLDTVYGIRWDHLGHTLSDLRDPGQKMQFWNFRWTGLFGGSPSWDMFRLYSVRAANKGQYGFRKMDLEKQVREGKGVMGTLSKMLRVQVGDPPKGYLDTEFHAVKLLWRIRIVCAVWVLVLLGFNVLFRFALSVPLDKWDVSGMLLATVVIVTSARFLLWEVGATPFARDIIRRNIASTPEHSPGSQVLNSTYIDMLPSPRIHDVLIDTNLDGLDFHPGNQRWVVVSANQLPWYLAYRDLPDIFTEAVINHTISLIEEDGLRTFLHPNIAGDWIYMESEETREATMRLMKEMLMCPQNGRLPLASSEMASSAPKLMRCDLDLSISRYLFHGSVKGRRKRNKASRVSSLMRIQPFAVLNAAKQAESSFEHPHKDTFQVGEIVDARLHHGKSRKWHHAKITYVISELYYDLQIFDVEEPEQRGVHREYIRRIHIPNVEPLAKSYNRLDVSSRGR